MSRLLFSASRTILDIKQTGEKWTLEEKATPHTMLCLAADPEQPGRLYGGTFNDGLWISEDWGTTWRKAGDGIFHNRVMSVAVSPTEKLNGASVVWAGTEPSGLFRSEDGGESWEHYPGLLDLPSKSSWSFPPRPYTHHVRWIEPDPHAENRIFVGIELGGVMKSEDKGKTWEDRKPGSQYDSHTLTTHPFSAGRIYEAAGGGFAESLDSGKTWQTKNEGLGDYNYLVEIAVNPNDQDTVIVSAAKGPHSAYQPENAYTVLMRRENNQPWEQITDGLPHPEGSHVFSLASRKTEPDIFYAVNNTGAYQSKDAGKTWQKLPVDWPEFLKSKRIHSVMAL